MARRKRPTTGFTPDAKALQLLRADTPTAIKRALRLAMAGGKQRSRRCLVCRNVGTFCQVWSDASVWQVEGTAPRPVRVYWLCARCHSKGDSEALRAKLEH